MDNSTNQTPAAPKTFDIIDGNTLMAQEYEPLRFAVDKILPHGLFILAGSGKIGKSWLSLDLCVNVATGGRLWDFSSEQGDVLYLALEDNYPRLQDRLNKIQAASVGISRLKLATAAFGISSGLLEQTCNHLADYPDTKLIVIDTLECIRDTEFDKNIYACDCRDMTALREITDKHRLTLLLIHHTRKMSDPDPLNTLSSSMGLVGSVDGVFVLEKDTRTGQDAKLTIANRDTEGFCFRLRFDPENCKWILVCNDGEQPEEKAEEKDEWLLLLVDEFLQDEWSGTTTELCDALKAIDPEADVVPLTISRRLKGNIGLFKENNIILDLGHDRKSRTITIKRQGIENPCRLSSILY
ncbi:helicase RepA family protein [Lachnospiraceae bacterium ZAX-1]